MSLWGWIYLLLKALHCWNAKLVLDCLPLQKSFHYIGLLKAVMRLSMTTMKASDAKEVASSITAIANEKLKAEKEANAGKKKQSTTLNCPIFLASFSDSKWILLNKLFVGSMTLMSVFELLNS